MACAVLVSLGALCGFAFDQRLWSRVAIVVPLLGTLSCPIAIGEIKATIPLLIVGFVYVSIGILWALVRYHRQIPLAWVLFVVAVVIFGGFLMTVVVFATVAAAFCWILYLLGIPLGALFRTAYDFRPPTGRMPRGLIHRQFSLRSMFWVTTWFAILFAVFKLENISLRHALGGSLAFLAAGVTMYAAVALHYRFPKRADRQEPASLPPELPNFRPPCDSIP